MKSEFLRVENLGLVNEGEHALRHVNLSFFEGEVLGVTGFFGSGKSTLAKCLAGLRPELTGRVYVRDRAVDLRSLQHAQAKGLFYIPKAPMLIPALSVCDNIFAVRTHKPLHVVYRERPAQLQSELLLKDIGLDIPGNRKAAELSEADAHLVQIVKVVAMNARVVILDRISGDYNSAESARLERTLRRFPKIAFVYISDISDPVLEMADRVVVMRDGRIAGTLYPGGIDRQRMIVLSRGKPIDEAMKRPSTAENREALFIGATENKSVPVPMTLHSGEILGMLDLAGDTRGVLVSELLEGTNLTLRVGGVACPDYRHAVRAGLSLVARNVDDSNLFHCFSLKENLTFQVLPKISRLGVIEKRVETFVFDEVMETYGLDSGRRTGKWHALHIVLCRWLANKPKAMVLDNVMAEMDPIVKGRISLLLDGLAAGGAGVLFLSTDWSDCYKLCDRVLILNHDGIVARVDLRETSAESFFELCSALVDKPEC